MTRQRGRVNREAALRNLTCKLGNALHRDDVGRGEPACRECQRRDLQIGVEQLQPSVSQLLAQRAVGEGRLQALSSQRVRGPAWACLMHRDSQDDPLARQFLGWLKGALAAE